MMSLVGGDIKDPIAFEILKKLSHEMNHVFITTIYIPSTHHRQIMIPKEQNLMLTFSLCNVSE